MTLEHVKDFYNSLNDEWIEAICIDKEKAKEAVIYFNNLVKDHIQEDDDGILLDKPYLNYGLDENGNRRDLPSLPTLLNVALGNEENKQLVFDIRKDILEKVGTNIIDTVSEILSVMEK